jgi:arsenate reductase (thioredoxin)
MATLKDKVLFDCVHNSARSQMAEERFEVMSAGLEPGQLNPFGRGGYEGDRA